MAVVEVAIRPQLEVDGGVEVRLSSFRSKLAQFVNELEQHHRTEIIRSGRRVEIAKKCEQLSVLLDQAFLPLQEWAVLLTDLKKEIADL